MSLPDLHARLGNTAMYYTAIMAVQLVAFFPGKWGMTATIVCAAHREILICRGRAWGVLQGSPAPAGSAASTSCGGVPRAGNPRIYAYTQEMKTPAC
jgi:hypothetical protein